LFDHRELLSASGEIRAGGCVQQYDGQKWQRIAGNMESPKKRFLRANNLTVCMHDAIRGAAEAACGPCERVSATWPRRR
jgi:hypothetical protein